MSPRDYEHLYLEGLKIELTRTNGLADKKIEFRKGRQTTLQYKPKFKMISVP